MASVTRYRSRSATPLERSLGFGSSRRPKQVCRRSNMLDRTCHITPDLISDYVADRLDDDDARVVEEAIDHNDRIAAAVATARQVNSRMARSFAIARH